jgi:hypothetical protein
MAPCYYSLGSDRIGQLDGPIALPPGKESPLPIGFLCDPEQGWT